MNILFLNHNIKENGTFIRCFNFAKHLVRFGHSVVILTSAPNRILYPLKEIRDGVEIVCMPEVVGKRLRNGGLGPLDCVLRCAFLFSRKIDIIECFDHRPVVFYPAVIAKYILRIPLVSEWTDLHGTGGSLSNRPKFLQKIIGPYENFTERVIKKIPAKLVVISRGLQKMAIDMGIPESEIVWIPGGADVENILPHPKNESRLRYKLPINKKIIVYTAGTQYDSELFLKAIYYIQQAASDVILVTTGSKMNYKSKSSLFDPQRVIELGFLPYDDYVSFLPCADLFMFPFANRMLNIGRWPNKVGDYMAAGRPIISNRTGDLIDLFEKHNIGLLADDDPLDLAQKVLEILSNPELAFQLGNNARVAAEKNFDWALLTKNLENCFIDISKQKENIK